MRGSKGDVPLPAQAMNWPTPRTSDQAAGRTLDHQGRRISASGMFGANLSDRAVNWPTPATRDFKGANSTDHVTTSGTGRMHMDQLPNFVEHAFRCSPQDQATPVGPTSLPERRTLNPLFVEWLMGWPIGWTGSAPVGTASSRWWQDMRGELSKLVSPPILRQPLLL